ncbi:thioredoxin domain-containing protein [Streptomyces albogriseolus]
MSDKNREGKRTARERMAAEREKQKTADKRRRTLIVGASVVCVLGLAAVIGVVAANSGGDDESKASGPVVAPSGAQGKDGLAIPVGKEDAKATLTVWEDFRCPACKAFEETYRSTLNELTEAGKLKVEYHLVTLIDGGLGGSGSLSAANAAACSPGRGEVPRVPRRAVREPADGERRRLLQRHQAVRPGEQGRRTGHPAFRTCVEDGTHDSWVVKSNEAFQKGGFSGTPTVLFDGENIYQDRSMTPEKLKEMVEEANKS